ncbi:GntR family transcriptional regulator [Acuticoccus mangrovi]|uniref:GntR family transcriptional regulator n=1 Tax=Acuticoccus mangrovi TaxID=2796142 RepID=A0A934MEB9_9HYPH|nr:GntR family transcriptional regulator [Acuticoccus mangrovi]MBJ3774223.1 GntR family transcriptional regulator [Acuticoccus mangrovi]
MTERMGVAGETLSDAAPSRAGAAVGEVVDALELEIVLGRLRPQVRLVEDELMLRFGAKRHVIRSALDALVAGGLVERRPHRGALVREYQADEVRELYAFRADLYRLAVAAMPLPFAPEVIAGLAAECTAHESAIAEGDLAAVIRHNDAFHHLFFAECGNRFVVEAVRRVDSASRAIRSYRVGDPVRLNQAAREHRELIAVAAEGDRARLAELAVRHILPSLHLYLDDRAVLDERVVPEGRAEVDEE